jgi:hypothetical protein
MAAGYAAPPVAAVSREALIAKICNQDANLISAPTLTAAH